MAEEKKEEIKEIVKEVLEESKSEKKDSKEDQKSKIQHTILNCINAENLTMQTIYYCYQQGANFVNPAYLISLQDCAETCRLTVNSALRESPFQKQIIKLSVEVCAKAMEVCREFENDDQMQSLQKYLQSYIKSAQEISEKQ